ncbi:hypothetical protein MMARJ_10960 [Mycobacterium marseillense]|uniref:Uncharacterized protein n=1 Tax=Mycobacterium marseillense TaxID=701042 RepID=A0ABM7J8X5_9MYCO|nr:hypothetical protein MMARJ_10960 [Mycobacterium marseillense]
MAGDAVDLAERQVLVLERVVVAALQLRQQIRGGGRRGDVRAHRHRVDQQPDHRFRVVDLQLADPRSRGAEDDVVLTGQRGQHQRPRGLQHGAERGVVRARQLAEGPGGLRGHARLVEAAAPLPQPVLGRDQSGSFEAGQQRSPGLTGGVEVAIGQPGEEGAIGAGGGQALPVVAGEDFAQQDGQRPAVEQDVVIGQHEPESPVRGADQRGPERRLPGEVAHRGAFGSAQLLDPRVGVVLPRAGAVELEVSPLHDGIGGNDLHGLVELFAEQRRQMGVSVDDGVHRVAQAFGVKRPGEREIQLDRVHVVAALRGAGVEQQTLLQRRQRQDVGDVVPARQLVDLGLAQAGRGDVRRGQPPATGVDVRADPGQRLEPQPAQPGDLRGVENRWRPGPFGVQMRSGAGVDGAGIELDGVHQRHGDRRRGADQGQAVLADAPALARRI